MGELPNAEQAIVPQLKVTHYLLSLTSKKGQTKARFFLSFGFTVEDWETMADALKRHAVTHPVASERETDYGIHY